MNESGQRGVTPSGAHVGETVREVRSAQGMSLRELAREIAVSAATLSAIETGKTEISVGRLRAIAAALGTTAAELLDRDSSAGSAASPAGKRTEEHGWLVRRSIDPHSGWRHFAPLQIDSVLEAAIAAFVETGYHGATMRSIAQRAGMSVPGVYHHYRSKQELLVTILDLTMADLLWRARAARSEGRTTTGRVALVVEAMALFHTHRRELAFIGASEMRSLEPANRRRIAGLRNDLQHMLDDAIAEAIGEGRLTTPSPRHGARAIATMCTSLPQWFRSGGPSTPEQIAAEYAQFALDLLGYQPAPSDHLPDAARPA